MTRINSNISSLQATHQLLANQRSLTESMQRLSTGLRINTGRDDPAGLIASESLRAEIRGIDQAIENSSRALNVLATADASLAEVSKLLLDIRGLVDHAANEGALSAEELRADQLQIDSILESIDRIANTTQFNGEKLLNGNFAYSLSSVDNSKLLAVDIFGARLANDGSTLGINVEVTQSAQNAHLTFTGSGLAANNAITVQVGGLRGSETFNFAGSTSVGEIAYGINTFTDLTGISATTSGASLHLWSTDYGSDAFVSVETLNGSFTVSGGETETIDHGVDPTVLINGQPGFADGLAVNTRKNGLDIALYLDPTFATTTGAGGTATFGITGGGARFQIGPDVNSNAQLNVGIPQISTSNLGDPVIGLLRNIGSGESKSILNREYADAEAIVKKAILQVATMSGRLGGIQRNQIEPNIRSQQVAYENAKASESIIRDTEYASEVADMTRAQILVQSTMTTLQLANQIPGNVLALLGG
ncbi:MAG: flagellin [Phycisphaerae bacterium]|nr:flagellin [Phycisphaerae bacterium]